MSSPDMVCVSTIPGGLILAANTSYRRALGYARKSMIGRRSTQLNIWRCLSDRRRVIEELRRTGRVRDKEVQWRHRSGALIWVSLSADIIEIDHQSCLLSVARDISTLKAASQALMESENKYRSLFESSRDAIMTIEPPTWRFTSVNPATLKLFGAKNEKEFISYWPGTLSPDLQPDGRVSAEKAKEMIETAVRKGSHFFEWTHRRISGEPFSATVLLSRMTLNGSLFIQATVRDITAQKRAEVEKLKAITRLNEAGRIAKVGGWEYDLIAGIHTWTEETYRIFEMDSTEDKPRLSEYLDFVLPAFRSTIKLAVQRAVEHGESFNLELEILTRKGNRRWVHITGEAHQENGKTKSLSGIVQDITDYKLLQIEQLHFSSRVLEAQEKERFEISATLHDNLGQLLSLAKMEAGSIRMPDDESRRRQLSLVTHLDEALAMVRHVSRTLQPPLLDDLGLRIAIKTLVEDVRRAYKHRVLFEQQGPDPVLEKPRQVCLYRVLQEALNNAVRHSKGKLILVTLRTDAAHVSIQVRDDGQGFDPEANAACQGIGLKGMRERMAKCGGLLEIQSYPNHGTILTAVLPLSAPAQGASS